MGQIQRFNVNKSNTSINYSSIPTILNELEGIICYTYHSSAYNELTFAGDANKLNESRVLTLYENSGSIEFKWYVSSEKTFKTKARSNNVDYLFINTITVGDNFVALSFIQNNEPTANRSSSTVVLTRTQKNNLCAIFPNNGCLIQEMNTTGSYGSVVRLNAITRDTDHSHIISYQPYASFNDYTTVFTPVLVNGDDDYCPHAFYTPSTEIKLAQTDDAIIDYNGKHYWYNGFIAVEI